MAARIEAARRRTRRAAGALVRRAPPPLQRLPSLALSRGPRERPFARFERDDGSIVELLPGYRDSVKSSWRVYWWPLRTLLELSGRIDLPQSLVETAAAVRATRTLPVAPADVARELQALVDLRPDAVEPPVAMDAAYGVPVVEPRRRPADVHAIVRPYLETAAAIERRLAPFGGAVRGARILETGCASGYLSFTLAARGAEHVTGIDLDVEGYAGPAERALVRRHLLGDSGRVVLEQGDVQALGFDDASFDLVVSQTVLEHVRDVGAAFREIARVLVPGGFAYHEVEPWFAPRGGHSLCTLDFPWGHVRTADVEFARYVETHRPLEAADAIRDHAGGFQRPRLTLAQTAAAARDAGLEVLRFMPTPLPLVDRKRCLLSPSVVRDCRRVHPSVTWADLLSISYAIVLIRPPGSRR